MRKTISIYIVLLFVAVFGASAQHNTDSDLFLKAVSLFSEDQFEQAQTIFAKLYASDPEDDAVNYYLGMCEFSLRRLPEAEKHLSKAVEKDSTNTWYLNALSSYYNAVGNRRKFAELTEKLVKISSTHANNPYTLYLLGDAFYSLSRDSLSLVYLDKALEISPEYAPAEFAKIEVLRSSGNFPQYFLALEKFMHNQIVEENIKLDYLTGIMDNMTSQFYWLWGRQVINLIDLCVELYPYAPKAHLLKVRVHMINNDPQSAISQCEKMAQAAAAIGDKDNLVQAYYITGDIYHDLGNTKACYAFYDEVLKVNPDFAPVLNNYAYFLSVQKRKLRKALKMSAKSIEIAPDNATYLDTYGWILYLLRKPQEAKPHFKRAMLFGGKDSAVILEHYSLVLKALGENDLALYYKTLSEQKASK